MIFLVKKSTTNIAKLFLKFQFSGHDSTKTEYILSIMIDDFSMNPRKLKFRKIIANIGEVHSFT